MIMIWSPESLFAMCVSRHKKYSHMQYYFCTNLLSMFTYIQIVTATLLI